jgi:glycosyltransferase involved in cell wall biosynthesis
MRKAILFYGYSNGIGLTSHFASSAQDLYRKALENGMSFYLVSDAKEQNQGLWDEVEKTLPSERIIKFDETDYGKLNLRIEVILRKHDHNTFHFQGIMQILKTKPLIKRYKDKVASIVTIHSFQNSSWRKNIVSLIYARLILKYINKVIFLSPFAWKSFLGSRLLFKKGKIVHIPFNLPSFETRIEEENILNDKDFNIVYLANFTKNKEHEKFLGGIIQFAREYNDVKIYFFGEGVRRSHVMDKIKRVSLNNNILCPGRVERKFISSILKKTSVALVFSSSETFGHTITEPMMMGIPVISTRVGCGEYLIQDGINGFGISNCNDLYAALKQLKSNSELRKEMGNNAKAIVNELYDYNRMIKAYINLYESV